MKNQISAVLIIIILLGVTSSATTANAQQVITPQGLVPQNQPVQQTQQEFNQPIPLKDVTTTKTPQDSTYNNYQPAVVDLNNPNTNPSLITNNNVIGLENTQAQQLQQQPIPITCASGVFVYQQNTLTGQVVPICVTSDMLANQLFNIDLNVKSSNNNNNNNDDNDDDNDKKKHHYYKYVNWNPRYDPIYKGANDPRNDPKYDSIDWQDDDSDKNLSVKAMDEILEDQQEEKENNGSDETTGQSNNDNDSGDSDGGSSDSESSDSDSGSSNDDDGGDSDDSGSSDSGNSGSDGGDSGGSDGGSSDEGSSDSGGGEDDSNN